MQNNFKNLINLLNFWSIHKNLGQVSAIIDGVAIIKGLENVKSGEMLDFFNIKHGVLLSGMALNLMKKNVHAVLFGNERLINLGDYVYGKGNVIQIPVGKTLLGRIISPLGIPLDGKGSLNYDIKSSIEKKAPGIIFRRSIFEPLYTGIKTIDFLVPIGRGQRELIIGDRQTGKTTVAIDTILNQAFEYRRTKKKTILYILCYWSKTKYN